MPEEVSCEVGTGFVYVGDVSHVTCVSDVIGGVGASVDVVGSEVAVVGGDCVGCDVTVVEVVL